MLSNTCRTSRAFAQRVGGRLLSRRSGSTTTTTTTAHRLVVGTATKRVPIRAMALAVDNLLLDSNRCFSTKGASSSAADEPPKEEVPEPATDEPVMEDKETATDEEEELKEAAAASSEEDATTTEEESSVVDDDESIIKLQAEIQSLKDQLLRSLAEQENTRRIAKRDVASAKQFAIKSFAKSLLEVSDNLSRAMESVPKELLLLQQQQQQQDDDDDQENHDANVLATLYEGIRMTEDGLTKTFASHGITKYGEIGQPFNPNIHDALFEYPDPKAEPGTLGQVMKKGYMLHDRVLRPAEVGVVKKKSE